MSIHNHSLLSCCSSTLLSLPRELIYKIASADAGVYNVILRLCRATTSLFPLSTRLDFMIAFGVKICMTTLASMGVISWSWRGMIHDVWGPGRSYTTGNRSYWRLGKFHRDVRPAIVWGHYIEWYDHDRHHRDLDAPAGTGVEWLRGAASMYKYTTGGIITVIWYVYGKVLRQVDIANGESAEQAAEVCAEIAYWLTQG